MSEFRGYLDMLRQQGREAGRDYGDFSRYLEKKARKMNVPLYGQFELTPLCNLSCKMCYVHRTEKEMAGLKPLGVSVWKDLMAQAFSAGMFEAALTGGECLTYPGFDELYLYLQSLGIQATVMTNGVLLNEERLRFFGEHPPALIQVTLYGPSEEAYERVTGRRAFQTVTENLRNLRAAGLPLSVTVTPNRHLGEDVFETLKLAHSLSNRVFINTSLFAPPEEPWRLTAEDELDAAFYARILRYDWELAGIPVREPPEDSLPEPGGPYTECRECGLTCGGGRSSFVIDWRGRLRPCNRLDAASDALKAGFNEAWREINQIANSWPRTAACQGCAYEEVCDHCAANRMKYAGPGKQPLALCRQTKYLVSKGVLPSPECDPA